MRNLPQSMQYQLTGADTIASTTRLHRWDSTHSSYVSESNNVAHIPVAAPSFIHSSEGYLFFTITNNSTTEDANLDGNANCVIQKVEISVAGSSGKVEIVENYNTLALLKGGYNNTLEHQNFLQNTAGAGTPEIGQTPDGFSLTAAAANSLSVALKLDCCGFLNDYYKKALPMGLEQFTITITFASADVAFNHTTNAAARTYTINNLRWYAPVYTIEDAGINASFMQQAQTRGIAWVGETCASIINTRTATEGTQSFQLNPRYKSLNALVSAQRPSAGLTTYNVNVVAATNIDVVSSYQYKLMGSNYPQDGIDYTATTNQSRAYLEAVKSLAPKGRQLAVGQQVTSAVFRGTTAANGKGLLAIDLKRFDEKFLVNCGLNTANNSAPSTLEVTYTGAGAAQQVLTFALYDIVFNMRPDRVVETEF